MDTSRKLERIAGNLEDMSVTLEEIREGVKTADVLEGAKLDKVQAEIEKATEMIEEYLDPAHPDE